MKLGISILLLAALSGLAAPALPQIAVSQIVRRPVTNYFGGNFALHNSTSALIKVGTTSGIWRWQTNTASGYEFNVGTNQPPFYILAQGIFTLTNAGYHLSITSAPSPIRVYAKGVTNIVRAVVGNPATTNSASYQWPVTQPVSNDNFRLSATPSASGTQVVVQHSPTLLPPWLPWQSFVVPSSVPLFQTNVTAVASGVKGAALLVTPNTVTVQSLLTISETANVIWLNFDLPTVSVTTTNLPAT